MVSTVPNDQHIQDMSDDDAADLCTQHALKVSKSSVKNKKALQDHRSSCSCRGPPDHHCRVPAATAPPQPDASRELQELFKAARVAVPVQDLLRHWGFTEVDQLEHLHLQDPEVLAMNKVDRGSLQKLKSMTEVPTSSANCGPGFVMARPSNPTVTGLDFYQMQQGTSMPLDAMTAQFERASIDTKSTNHAEYFQSGTSIHGGNEPKLDMRYVTQMPALGRSAQLGMLYDYRANKFVDGSTLWDVNALKADTIINNKPTTEAVIIADDLIDTKFNSLKLKPEMKLSVLAGMLSISGPAARYLEDHCTSSLQCRVTLHCSSEVRTEHLAMNILGKHNVQCPNVMEDQKATHVVVGVTYGTNVFMLFDDFSASSPQEAAKAKKNLEALVSNILKESSNFDCLEDLDEHSRVNPRQPKCTYHSDIRLPKRTSTFQEAIKIYQKMQNVAETTTTNNVPKGIWLYPLSKIAGRSQTSIAEISEDIVDTAIGIMQSLLNAKMQATDIGSADIYDTFPDLKERNQLFLATLDSYNGSFKKKLQKLLLTILAGTKDETDLEAMFAEHAKTPFATKALDEWFKQKMSEQRALCTFFKPLEKFPLCFDASDLEELCYDDSRCSQIVCLEFRAEHMKDTFLEKLQRYGTDTFKEPNIKINQNVQPKTWFENQATVLQIRQHTQQFKDYAEAAIGNGQLKVAVFVVSEASSDHAQPGISRVVVYQNGAFSPFEPPAAPNKPELVSAKSTTLELTWSHHQAGKSSVIGYICFYRTSPLSKNLPRTFDGQDESWSTQRTNLASITLTNLQPETTYECKVQGITSFGNTMASDVLTAATLEMNQLNNRSACKLLNDAIHIEEGEPSIYHIKMRTVYENNQNRIRKYVIGEKPKNAIQEKVILVMGASGAGKSTLINAMVNYVYNVQWKDGFRLKAIVEQDEADQTKSMTSFVTAYTFYPDLDANIDFALTIVDTPGFADTSGINRDKETTQQLQQLFSTEGVNGIDILTAVGFVVHSSTNRLTAAQTYVFDCILSVFGKNIAENIFLMITFADDRVPPVLAAVKEAKVPSQGHFRFNNSALFAQRKDEGNFTELYWRMGQKSMETFFTSIYKVPPKSLQLTKEVLRMRDQLEASIEALQLQVTAGLGHMNFISQLAQTIDQHAAEVNANVNFQVDVQVPKIEKIEMKEGEFVTNCHHCNFTCHSRCAYANDEDKAKCVAMNSEGFCKECPDKCHWKLHANMPYRFEVSTVTEKRTLEEIKSRYNIALDKKGMANELLNRANKEHEATNRNVVASIKEMKFVLDKLAEIALKPNHMTSVEYIEVLIESEKAAAKPGWQGRVTQLEHAKKTALLLRCVNDQDVEMLPVPSRGQFSYDAYQGNTGGQPLLQPEGKSNLWNKMTGYAYSFFTSDGDQESAKKNNTKSGSVHKSTARATSASTGMGIFSSDASNAKANLSAAPDCSMARQAGQNDWIDETLHQDLSTADLNSSQVKSSTKGTRGSHHTSKGRQKPNKTYKY